jgi:uncharacterized membrane protein
MKYLEREHPGDYAAILWLRANARRRGGVPVILEAVGGSYTYYARISTHTGCRAVLGWSGHESVWRGPWPSETERDVRNIYSNPHLSAVLPLLEKYGVDYVYVGELERNDYPAKGLAKFDRACETVYRDPAWNVVIYRPTRFSEEP